MKSLLPELRAALVEVVPQLHAHCRQPWWVIGSAAVALAGAEVEVADIDVLTSRDDAERLAALWHELREPAYEPAGADRFRSQFARFRFAGMPVEVMGGLELHGIEGWQPVQVRETQVVVVDGIAVHIPARAEQIRLLHAFGRAKDFRRAALLQALSGVGSC